MHGGILTSLQPNKFALLTEDYPHGQVKIITIQLQEHENQPDKTRKASPATARSQRKSLKP